MHRTGVFPGIGNTGSIHLCGLFMLAMLAVVLATLMVVMIMGFRAHIPEEALTAPCLVNAQHAVSTGARAGP